VAKLSRRDFIQKGSIGVAAAGAMLVVPLSGTKVLSNIDNKPKSNGAVEEALKGSDPVVIHIADKSTGEIHFYFGDKEVVHTNPSLVAQLLASI
jgi:hypothetical protein